MRKTVTNLFTHNFKAMQKYRKKPIVIEAVQLTKENFKEVCEWIGPDILTDGTSEEEHYISVFDGENDLSIGLWDYVIKGIEGEFYSCSSSVFDKTYEKVI